MWRILLLLLSSQFQYYVIGHYFLVIPALLQVSIKLSFISLLANLSGRELKNNGPLYQILLDFSAGSFILVARSAGLSLVGIHFHSLTSLSSSISAIRQVTKGLNVFGSDFNQHIIVLESVQNTLLVNLKF